MDDDPLLKNPVEVRVVVNWMGDHGYRDLVPRRDAVFTTWLTYYFVREGRRKCAITAVNGLFRRDEFESLKIEVERDEQNERKARGVF